MALMKMPCAVGTGGGSVNYDMTNWSGVISAGSKQAITGLKGKPKSAYMLFEATNGAQYIYTNVNPTTNEADETGATIYRNYIINAGTTETWNVQSDKSFVIGNDSIELSSSPIGGANYKQMVIYTY